MCGNQPAGLFFWNRTEERHCSSTDTTCRGEDNRGRDQKQWTDCYGREVRIHVLLCNICFSQIPFPVGRTVNQPVILVYNKLDFNAIQYHQNNSF